MKNVNAFLTNQKTKISRKMINSKSCKILAKNDFFLSDFTDTYEKLPIVISKPKN